MIKIDTLRYFCTVAQTGNLGDAAQKLGRTQSAVSMTLKQLETHLSSKLFEGERKSVLTPLGEQVFALASRQVRQFDETVQSIEAASQANRGLLRIASVPSVASLIFPKVLSFVKVQHPEVEVELWDMDSQQVLQALADGRADIGIASGHHAIKNVTADLLFEDRFGVVCLNTHPLIAQAHEPRISDVVTASFVRNSLCETIETQDFADALTHATVTIHNTHSLATMIQTGQWVTLLPETAARFMPAAVAFRAIADLPETRSVYLYTRQKTRFDGIVRNCSTFIRGCKFG